MSDIALGWLLLSIVSGIGYAAWRRFDKRFTQIEVNRSIEVLEAIANQEIDE